MTKQRGGSDKCLQIFEGRIHWGGREMLQCEPYQVVGLGAKGWNQKRKNKTKQKKKIPSKSKNSTEGYINQSPHENDIYPYPPHWGHGDFLWGRKLSIWDIWEDCRSALLLAELRERAVPWCWETNRSLSGQQVSHQHCQLESFRQEVKVVVVSNWNHKRKVCLE